MNAAQRLSSQFGSGWRKRPWRVVAALTLLGAALLVPARSATTLASWGDAEYGSASMAALVVPPPTLGASCTLVPGLLGADPVITFTWSIPAGYGLALADISYGISGVSGLEVITGGLLASVVTTGPVAGVYTTKFNSGLLGGLLGSSKTAGVRFTLPGTTWVSNWATVTASAGLLGANPSCVVN